MWIGCNINKILGILKEGDRSNSLARNYFPEHNDPFHSPKEQKYLDYTKSVGGKKGWGGGANMLSATICWWINQGKHFDEMFRISKESTGWKKGKGKPWMLIILQTVLELKVLIIINNIETVSQLRFHFSYKVRWLPIQYCV